MGKKKKGSIKENRIKSVRHSRLYHPVVRRFSEREVQPILKEIQRRNNLNDPIRIGLVNYLVLRSVSVFEHYFRSLVKRYADNVKNNVRLKDFFENPGNEKSKGGLIISNFNFMDMQSVNFVMSKLFKTNFLQEIKNESVRYAPDYSLEYAQIKFTKPLNKNWKIFLNTFEKRNSIAHENKLFNMKYSEIRNFVGNTIQFMMCAEMFDRGID